MNNTKIPYFDKIGVSERIDVSKTIASKECDICHYWYFLNEGFKFQPNFCNRHHNLLMSMNISDVVIPKIKGSDYCCIITGISKSEAIKLLQNFDLIEKVAYYKTKHQELF